MNLDKVQTLGEEYAVHKDLPFDPGIPALKSKLTPEGLNFSLVITLLHLIVVTEQ